ncbi:hypothetical protein DENSPDRAFT_886761 [Dentipellis sp. KUC8613]|nr:hypothetical protein DENSPDRAFT_886761 [Dentipellis sp. KUC8613]
MFSKVQAPANSDMTNINPGESDTLTADSLPPSRVSSPANVTSNAALSEAASSAEADPSTSPPVVGANAVATAPASAVLTALANIDAAAAASSPGNNQGVFPAHYSPCQRFTAKKDRTIKKGEGKSNVAKSLGDGPKNPGFIIKGDVVEILDSDEDIKKAPVDKNKVIDLTSDGEDAIVVSGKRTIKTKRLSHPTQSAKLLASKRQPLKRTAPTQDSYEINNKLGQASSATSKRARSVGIEDALASDAIPSPSGDPNATVPSAEEIARLFAKLHTPETPTDVANRHGNYLVVAKGPLRGIFYRAPDAIRDVIMRDMIGVRMTFAKWEDAVAWFDWQIKIA